MKYDSAFSGLEAAIVLIAFVVVAAVFSYVMLGAGFFATQKSQEVTYSGIKQATSNVILDGQLYGDASPIASLSFFITVPEGGQAQKLGDIEFVMTCSDYPNPVTITGGVGPFFKDRVAMVLAKTHVIRAAEKVQISFNLGASTPGQLNAIGAGDKFTVEMKPKVGAATLISKSLGSGYDKGVIV